MTLCSFSTGFEQKIAKDAKGQKARAAISSRSLRPSVLIRPIYREPFRVRKKWINSHTKVRREENARSRSCVAVLLFVSPRGYSFPLPSPAAIVVRLSDQTLRCRRCEL